MVCKHVFNVLFGTKYPIGGEKNMIRENCMCKWNYVIYASTKKMRKKRDFMYHKCQREHMEWDIYMSEYNSYTHNCIS